MKHKHVRRLFHQSKSAKISLTIVVFLIGLALAGHIITRKSADATKVSEWESLSPRPRPQESRDDPALSPAHRTFRANLSSSMTGEALSEHLRSPRFLRGSEIVSLIEQYGFEEIISYLSFLPDGEEYHNDIYQLLRQHLAHLLLSGSIDEFVESVHILPELATQGGISCRLQALELIYPESRLLERIREAGVNYEEFYITNHMFFITLYDHVESMAEVVKLVETTQTNQPALVDSLKEVPISLLPSRTSDDGIFLFDFLEKVKTEDPLHYKQSGIEEALELWLTTE